MYNLPFDLCTAQIKPFRQTTWRLGDITIPGNLY